MAVPVEKCEPKPPIRFPFGTFVMEPVGVVFGFAFAAYGVIVLSALYRKNCIQNYLDDVNVDCYDLGRNPDVEDDVQTSASYWNAVIFSVGLLSSVATLLIMGGFSDKYGRKTILLFGLSGTMVYTLGFIFVIANTQVSIYAVLPFSVVGMSMGGLSTFMSGMFAYQADIIPNRRILTQRLAGLQFSMTLGNILGGIIVSVGVFTPLTLLLITQCLYVILFFYILAFTIQKSSMKKRSPAAVDKKSGKRTTSIFSETASLLKLTIRSITKPRVGHRRLYIWLSFYIFMSNVMVQLGIHITFPLYVFRRPFEWHLTQLAAYNTVSSCMQLIGTLLGALILKKLRISEPAIVIICASSYTLSSLMIGVAKDTAMIYIAAILGSLSVLAVPAAKALVIACIGPDEIGQIFTGIALASSAGVLIASVIFNIIYALTESFFPGCVFLLQALIGGIGIFGAVFIYFDSKKDVELMKTMKMMSFQQPRSALPKTEVKSLDSKF